MQFIITLLLTIMISSSGFEPSVNPTQNAQITADNCDILINLDHVEELKVTPNLIEQFYFYYSYDIMGRWELLYLPEFSTENNTPDWDMLSLYVYFMQDEDDGALTKEKFQEIVRQYMGAVNYVDKSSEYLEYENGVYTPRGFSLILSEFYRLTALTKDADQVYTAVFDILTVMEGDWIDPESSSNMKTIVDYNLEMEEKFHHTFEIQDSIKEIFLQENYADILEMNGTVTISFTVTENKDNPFHYLSCVREKERKL